jgi:DNA-binding NarL/FixJ family response regulator
VEGSKNHASVLIADDHVIVRKGVRALLEAHQWKVVGEAGTGLETIELARRLHPELVVIDLSMPRVNGLTAVPEILRASPSSRILVFSMHDEEELIQRTLHAGASGYVLKSDAEQSLVRAAAAIAAGRKFVSPSVSRIVLNHAPTVGASRRQRPLPYLTAREQEVLQLLAEGLSNKQVADVLDLSVRTAENHRARLMKKLGVHTLSGLVRYAIRNHIIHA